MDRRAKRSIPIAVLVLCLAVAGADIGFAVARSGHHPRPLRTTAPLRFTHEGCPSSIRSLDEVVNPEPDHLDRTLVLPDPESALICRFTPLGGVDSPSIPHGKLYRSVAVRKPDARRLAVEANRIPQQPSNATFGCPADFAQYDVVIFRYETRADVDLLVSRSGCRVISNGYTRRIGIGSGFKRIETFLGDVDRLAGPLYRQPGL